MQLFSFGGAHLGIPGAYSVVNIKNNTPYTPGALKVLAVIGSGLQGAPANPSKMYFNNPQLASDQIGGTDALLAAQIAWDHGADLICFSLTDVATQATYNLQSTDATPVTLATYQGKRWNANDNKLQVTTTVQAGGSQTVTITDTSVSPSVVETYTVQNTADGWTSHIKQVNNQSTLANAVAGPGGSTTNVAATVSSVAFTGGTRTAPTTTSIAAAIDALKTEDIQGIITPMTDTTSQDAIKAHCNTMSNVTNRRERRAFYGLDIGSASTDYVTAMQDVDGRGTLACPGIYRTVNGDNTLLSSAFHAAALAGLWAGRQNPNDPITFKLVKCNGLEEGIFATNEDINTLVEAQVTVTQAVPKVGYRVVHALTGDTSGTNMVELSVADLVDIMNRSMREQLEAFVVGKASYNGIVNDLQQKAQSILEAYKKQNWIVDGTDAFGNPLPAYRNIVVTQQGTTYPVTYEMSPCEPVNYIPVTVNVNA